MNLSPVLKFGVLGVLAAALPLGFAGTARACDDDYCYRPTYRKSYCAPKTYCKSYCRPKVIVIVVKRANCYKAPARSNDYQDQQNNYNNKNSYKKDSYKKDSYKKDNYKNNSYKKDNYKDSYQDQGQSPQYNYQKKPAKVAPKYNSNKKPRVAPKTMKRAQDDDAQLID
jgi:hypothetical protein